MRGAHTRFHRDQTGALESPEWIACERWVATRRATVLIRAGRALGLAIALAVHCMCANQVEKGRVWLTLPFVEVGKYVRPDVLWVRRREGSVVARGMRHRSERGYEN